MPNGLAESIQENYGTEPLLARVQHALAQAGFTNGSLNWRDIASIDQFHVRGLEATKELAEVVGLKDGETVLDVGSGLGGPARYLAAVHAARVTGLDLVPEFIPTSEYLSQRCGLAGMLDFKQGDATELSFANGVFDVVWTQHAAMNIPDKVKLYRGFHRVLKEGGRVAMFDVIRGGVQPVIYPTPWAGSEDISFLSDEREMHAALIDAGFADLSVVDQTDVAAQWFRDVQREQQQNEAVSSSSLSLGSILGPHLKQAISNFARNILEGRVRIVQIVARKS